MARYGKATSSTPRAVSPPCDLCGKSPAARWHREVTDGRCVDIRARAQNRVRVEAYWAGRVGRPELGGKLLCPACYEVHVLLPINAAADYFE